MMMPMILFAAGLAGCLVLLVLAFSGPSAGRAQNRRLEALKGRYASSSDVTAQAQLKGILAQRETKLDDVFTRFVPKPAALRKRLDMTGRDWTLGQYSLVCVGIALGVAALIRLKGAPLPLAIFVGLFVGLGLPHKAIGMLINKRVKKFTAKFPDAIDLLVRGLRSGLPISETLTVVGQEVPGPVGVEFRAIGDRVKIGRTMEVSLQETADRLGTPEFQFFVITLSIQRETGGNLAETLSNLSEVLRKRSQMKLKIKAMSSEAKASAIIVGSLPFIVFIMVWFVNGDYMKGFFTETRLMIAGLGGLCWMAIGAFIMAKMVNFEI